MNMISTGAFQTEMDASNKQATLAEKFAAVWEKKNAKAARAGGVSLMALSLAACGSDDATTSTSSTSTTTTTTTTAAAKTVAFTASSVTGLFDSAGDSDTVSDTYIGQVTYSDANPSVASGSFEAGDTLDGGAGTADTLSLTVTGGGATYVTAALPGALVTGIENLVVRAIHAAAADIVTLDMASMASVTSVQTNLSTSVMSVSNAVSTDTFTVTGNGSTTTAGMTIGYTATQTSGTVNIDGDTVGGTITVTGTALTSQTINSTGGTNVLTGVTGAATTEDYTISASTSLDTGTGLTNVAAATGNTITVSGAAENSATGARAVDLGSSAVDADVDTIDASGLTAGGIEVTLNSSTTVAVTGGAGNDDVTTGAVLTTGSADAGAGTADKLTVAGATHLATAALGAKYTNFETLENATTSIQNMSLISGITSVTTSGAAGGFNNMSAAQLGAITNTVDQTSITYLAADGTGTTDVANITLKNATATSSADLAGAVLTGTETANITSSSGNVDGANAAGNIVTFAAGGANMLTAIDVGGAYGLNLTLDNTAKAVTVTNSQTGLAEVDLDGEVIKGSSITTSSNADSIETALAAVAGTSGEYATYNAGAGNDAISTHLTAVNNTSAAAASLKIDGGAGTDTLSFAAANVTFTDAMFQHITNMESYTVAATANTSITTGGFFDINNAGNTATTITAASIANGSTYTLDAQTFSGALTNTVTSASNGVTTADNVTISTGSGADTITVTAASFVSVAGINTGYITVSAGAGDDTISVSTGTLLASTTTSAGALGPVEIQGGKGADSITASHVTGGTTGNFAYVYAAGDSVVGGHDIITGFGLATGSLFADTLDLVGTGIAGNTAGTNGTDNGVFKSHAITAGLVTFDDVDTFAAAISVNDNNLADAIGYLNNAVSTSGDTVMFGFDSNGDGTNESTIVFQQNGATDTVIELAGTIGISITATNAATAGLIDIA
jgi:hypothetical protein